MYTAEIKNLKTQIPMTPSAQHNSQSSNNRWLVISSLALIYIVFAILLNSVGTVILQVINTYDVSKVEASILEGLKDLPIAIVGFVLASFAPRIGYKRSLIIGTVLVGAASVAMPLLPSFATTKLLFFIVGCSFGLVKIAVYSTIGLIAESKKQHASLTNIIEGIFMVGVLLGYWLFAYFISPDEPKSPSWLQVYWPILAITVVSLLVTLTMRLDESQARVDTAETHSITPSATQDFVDMLMLAKVPMVFIFMLSAFIYVLIEQGIGSWLPTFNNEVFKLPANMSVQFASIYAAALALGRFGVGIILRRVSWYPVINVCVLAAAALIIIVIPATKNIVLPANMGWGNAPWAVFLLPMVGLVMAPIYPAINSSVLSALPRHKHAAMTGLIVIPSALGGTTGSIIMGWVFEIWGGSDAFLLLLAPIALIMITLFFFKRSLDRLSATP